MIFKITSLPQKEVSRMAQASEFITCKCGITRKSTKECSFCGRGAVISPNRVINRYHLVDAEEITPCPRGDHYMERTK